jgi:TniQ
LFEHGLSGRLWPIHVKPYADELLSSWVVRLSRAYGRDPQRFCARVWGHTAFWSRDIDKGLYADVLEVLSAKTATPRTRVFETTLAGYRSVLARELSGYGRSPWLLSLGMRTGRREGAWVAYCPSCLQGDAEPYFRRQWRLAFVTVCPQHRCQLLDRCAACAAPCHLHRVPSEAEAMTCCYRCRFDVRRARAPVVPPTADGHRLMQFQTLLVEALHHGWYPLAPTDALATAEYFSVLTHLGRLLLRRHRAHEQRRKFRGPVANPLWEPSWLSSSECAIEMLPVTDRFTLMLLLGWWLDQWPEQFVTMCAMAQLSRADLSSGFPCVPAWYEVAVAQVAQSHCAGMQLVSYRTVSAVASSSVTSHLLL